MKTIDEIKEKRNNLLEEYYKYTEEIHKLKRLRRKKETQREKNIITIDIDYYRSKQEEVKRKVALIHWILN